MTTRVSQAPAQNLVTATMAATSAVAVAPIRLMIRPLSSRARAALPAHEHRELADRERGEDADRVERNQVLDFAVVDRQHDRRQQPERDDAGREGQPIAPERELARHEAVARQEVGQAREIRIGGVGAEDEDRHRRELDVVVAGVRAAECVPGDLGDDRLVSMLGRPPSDTCRTGGPGR